MLGCPIQKTICVEARVAHAATLGTKLFRGTFVATDCDHSVCDDRPQFSRDFHQDQELSKSGMRFSIEFSSLD
eukprot:Skav211290  [mRNA]  locus=scaffold2429:190967:191481:- [translate_table: standard]